MALGEETEIHLSLIFFLHPGSEEERKAMQKASSFIRPAGMGIRARFASTMSVDDMDSRPGVLHETVSKTGLQLEINNTDALYPGNPLELAITVKTSVPGNWTINLAGSCQLQSYTGKIEASLGYIKETIKLEGNSGRHRKLAVFSGLLSVAVWGFT